MYQTSAKYFEIPDQLDLDKTWSIGETAFRRIATLLFHLPQLERIVEFGSGPSSVRLAMAFSGAQVLSLEGDWDNFIKTNDLMEVFWNNRNLSVKYRPIRCQYYGDGSFLTYEEGAFFDDQRGIDCVIIDGPPFYTLRGREACLYQVYDQIKVGGLIVLDDYRRSFEKQIVENWLSVYADSFEVEIVSEDHHLAVLRKVKSGAPCWQTASRCLDVKTITHAYFQISNALLHIDDVYLMALAKASECKTDLVQLFDVIRNIYGVTSEHIQMCTEQNTGLSKEDVRRKKNACYKTVFKILYQDGQC